jgi:hypothetical protein
LSGQAISPLQVEIVRVSRIIAGLALALGITFCFAFFVALGSPGAASKIWERLGNLSVSRRVPPA